jgi:hypothetical protein
VVAKLLQNVDGFEGLRPDTTKKFLDLGRSDEKTIEGELKGTEGTEYDMFVFDGDCMVKPKSDHPSTSDLGLWTLTILGQQVIRPPNDKFADQYSQIFQFRIALLLFLVTSISVSSSQNLVLKVLAKVQASTEIGRIGKVEKRKVFREVVLDRRARKDDAALAVDGCECLEGLGVWSEMTTWSLAERLVSPW